MSEIVIKAENISKQYQLGKIGYGTLKHDLQSWWARIRGKEDPNNLIGSSKHKDLNEDFWALKDISFEIQQGESVGIIGKNGAGKSTLLKILSRTTAPTSGNIFIKGKIASLLEVGTGFHPDLTGRENVYLNGAILGMKKREIDKKFDEIVDFSGIEKFIDTPVKRYSSGMYVRLAFAVAAHLDSDILILDEVLSVGDAEFQKKCLGKMDDVSKGQGRTVLFVSHNMIAVKKLCNCAIFLSNGKLINKAATEKIISEYLEGNQTKSDTIWDNLENAPGNDVIRLCSVKILQGDDKESKENVDISKEVKIEISYFNFKENAKFFCSIWLIDKMDNVVFTTANLKNAALSDDQWCSKPCPKGLFKSICRIPGNFLNDGKYSINLFLGTIVTNPEISISNVISFTVLDNGEMRYEHFGEWIGIIRPKLAWDTQFLGNN